jgi:hypothetical protein
LTGAELPWYPSRSALCNAQIGISPRVAADGQLDRLTTHFAVLDHRSVYIRFDRDIEHLSAPGAENLEVIHHWRSCCGYIDGGVGIFGLIGY